MVSHGYKLEDRSAGRGELKSPLVFGTAFWVVSVFSLFIWPLLIALALMAFMQPRERVLLEVVDGKVVESRSVALSKLIT